MSQQPIQASIWCQCLYRGSHGHSSCWYARRCILGFRGGFEWPSVTPSYCSLSSAQSSWELSGIRRITTFNCFSFTFKRWQYEVDLKKPRAFASSISNGRVHRFWYCRSNTVMYSGSGSLLRDFIISLHHAIEICYLHQVQ